MKSVRKPNILTFSGSKHQKPHIPMQSSPMELLTLFRLGDKLARAQSSGYFCIPKSQGFLQEKDGTKILMSQV